MFRDATPDRLDLAALFEASPNPYVILDRDLVMVGMNRAYLKVTMRDRESLIGRRMFDAFPSDPDSVAGRQLRTSLQRVLRTGRVDHLSSIHYPIPRADGSLEDRYWSATHTPLFDVDGAVAGVLQHTVDVTELTRLRAHVPGRSLQVEAGLLRRAEALQAEYLVLDDERARLRSLFAQAPGFMSFLRGPDHVFELVNDAYLSLIGPERAPIGRPIREVLPEAVEQGFGALLDQVFRSGEPFVGRGVTLTLQPDPQAPPRELILDFVYQPWRGADGAVEGIFVQGIDISEQQRARMAAASSEHRFRTLAHSMPMQVWTALPDGRIDWQNAQVARYAGTGAGEAGDWRALVHAEEADAVAQAWQAAVAAAADFQLECRLRRADGEHRWHLVRALPMRGEDGRIRQWIGTSTDIDDRKAAEALLASQAAALEQRVAERSAELMTAQDALRQSQKMESIGNLAGGIAHDFNNLLQVIHGNLQLIARQVAGQERVETRVQGALDAVRRGAKLSAQLLAFGRRQPLAPRVVDIGRLVRGLDEILRRTIGAGIDIETIVAGGLWNTLVDPTNVETALLNLAINARDAMGEKGRLTIEVGNAWLDDHYARAHPEVTAGQYVMLAVSDTGCGIPPALMARVFEPFFTTKPVGKGTGLGLAMVYGFVKQSGGHVKVYSEPGQGTTLKLYFPRSMQPEDAVGSTVVDGGLTGGTETILVAEDDDAVAEIAVALLQELGYRVLRARDAEGALAIIESGIPIDLLFTDVVMPGALRTPELARRAQARLPRLAVLFTSGYTENAIVHAGRLDAGVHLLGKPYSREELAAKVREVLAAGPAAA